MRPARFFILAIYGMPVVPLFAGEFRVLRKESGVHPLFCAVNRMSDPVWLATGFIAQDRDVPQEIKSES